MKVIMPELISDDVIEFCNDMNSLDLSGESEIIYDYGQMSTFEPFGMLVASAKIRELFNTHTGINHRDRNYKKHGYGGTMGFFQSVYQDFGKLPGQASGSSNYIPMTSIDLHDLEKEKKSKIEHIGESIERHSMRLAKVFSRGNEQLETILTYMIREIMRNIIEHSESRVIWFAGQGWPSIHEVEIAIADEGLGIMGSLSKNFHYENIINDNQKALEISVLPGVTKAFNLRKRKSSKDFDAWENSGFGLYMTKELCNKFNGHFIMLSGDKAMIYEDSKTTWKDSSYKGTAICLRINTRNINNVSSLMSTLIEEGEFQARKMKKLALNKASSASKTLSISKVLANKK